MVHINYLKNNKDPTMKIKPKTLKLLKALKDNKLINNCVIVLIINYI